jgi:superfamily II DNA or RNA helicase
LITQGVLDAVRLRLIDKNRDSPLPGGLAHQAIVIARHSRQADAAGAYLTSINVTNLVYHTQTDKTSSSMKGLLTRFKQGHFRVLVVVGQLLEGFDHPPISLAAVLTNIGRNGPKFNQFVGRAVRIVRKPAREAEGIKADLLYHEKLTQEKNIQKLFKGYFGEGHEYVEDEEVKSEDEGDDDAKDEEGDDAKDEKVDDDEAKMDSDEDRDDDESKERKVEDLPNKVLLYEQVHVCTFLDPRAVLSVPVSRRLRIW